MKKIYFLLAILIGLSSGSHAQTTSFVYTGAVQYFTVPMGVTNIGVIARGARGGYNSTMYSTTCSATLPDSPGFGGCVEAKLAVTPGQVLNIYVGKAGTDGFVVGCAATPGTGGYNGGGDGGFGYGSYGGGGGGGGSDVRIGGTALTDRVIAAAGGGGAGGNYYTIVNAERGGHGGTTTGMDGYGNSTPFAFGGAQGGGPSSGGTQGAYGAPWAPGLPGVLGIGGNAGTGVAFSGSGGGGGGGGYYGGGGGSWGGGGGGSSWADPALATAVIQTRGCNDGDGTVDICLNNPGTIIGTHPICSGLTLQISETVGGGTWSSSNTAVATIGSTTGIVTSIFGGTTTITYTVTSACATVYATITFVVTASPDPITGTNPVCVGSTAPFTSTTPGGKWTISTSPAATISKTGLVTGIYPGRPTVTYTAATGPACYTTYTFDVDGIAGPLTVCNGLTIPLVSSTGGGVWSSSNTLVASISGTSPSGTLTGVNIGTSTISYSSTVCPSAITVTVNPIAPNAGADSICTSSTGYVTNIIGGGTWSSSDGSVAKAGTLTGLVTGISAGTAVISYLLPTGCLSQSQVRIIDKAPPITGFPEVCPGNTTTLADAQAGGIWSTINTTVATISSGGVVTGVNSDTVSILYSTRPGCVTSVLVKVNPIPFPITGRDTLCPGVLDTLFDKSTGGLWSTTTPALDTIVDSTGILTSRLSGLAVVKYTLPTGCFTTKNIYIYPVPVPTVTYNPYTNSLYTGTGYPQYQWYDSITGLIPHATSPTLAATYSQWYFVEVTDVLGCKSRSGLYYHDIKRMGIDNLGNDIVISVYPNPVSGLLNIESTVKVRVVISTMDGKIAMQQTDAKQMDVSRLASAMYLVSLYDETGQLLTVQKLVKE
ncbi:MAG: surface protein [Flavipsychrobacter sp.]|nr:surface protein [Flavipsychrobacter sp.]